MTTGDIVALRLFPDKLGVITLISAGAFATWCTVLWNDGQLEVHDVRELSRLNEKG